MNPINHLTVNSLGVLPLGSFWNGMTLRGDFWRLYWHDRRGAAVFINGEVLEFEPGAIYLLAPNCNLKTRCANEPVQLYIHFELAGLTGATSGCFKIADPPSAARLLELLRTGGSMIDIRIAALALAAQTLALLPAGAVVTTHSDDLIAASCAYLKQHLAEALTLGELARRAGMSPNAFARRFREHVGGSPYGYLLQLRYQRAAALLESPKYSIEEICEQIGVNDRFHFSRRFKKLYGIPPAAYRKHYQR